MFVTEEKFLNISFKRQGHVRCNLEGGSLFSIQSHDFLSWKTQEIVILIKLNRKNQVLPSLQLLDL